MSGCLLEYQATWVGFDVQAKLCLDSNTNGNGYGSVYTDSCNGDNYQTWQFVGATIVNRQTGYCLDSDIYGNVYTDSCNTGNYQN